MYLRKFYLLSGRVKPNSTRTLIFSHFIAYYISAWLLNYALVERPELNRLLPLSPLGFSDPEYLCPTYRACTACSRSLVL